MTSTARRQIYNFGILINLTYTGLSHANRNDDDAAETQASQQHSAEDAFLWLLS